MDRRSRLIAGGEFYGLAGFLEVILEPVECPDLGVLVLPVLHPAYQHA